MKCAFVDLDGTLVNLPTDHEECKRLLGVSFYKDVPQSKYCVIDVYEGAAVGKSEMIREADRFMTGLQELSYYIVLVTRTGKRAVDLCMKKFRWLCPDLILSRDEATHLKPDARHVTLFIHADKIDKDSIVVGDSWHDAELAKALGLTYYNSVSAAMKGLGLRKSLHNDGVYSEELKFLKEYGKSPTLDCGSGGRRGGDVCIDKIPGADFVADMTDLPFSAETFNSVFMIHSLEHVNDFHKAISEAWRVLKVDGILGVVVPTQKMSYLDPDHKHHEHPGWWEDIVELNKFELIARKNIKSEFDDKPVDFSVALVFKKVNG